MTFAVHEFDDLIKILNAQPEWRSQLRRALFPEIDIPKALQELVDVQRRTEEALHRLVAAIDRLTSQQGRIVCDVRDLKGLSHERTYRDKAVAIFGRLIRNGHDVTNWVADQLYDALVTDQVTEDDIRQVLAVDLLWGGAKSELPQLPSFLC